MGTLLLDLRHALRALRRSPWFFLVAAGTLASGIGATTAVWSVVDGVLLRPLPLPDSPRLVKLMQVVEGTGERFGVNFHSFHHWRRGSRSFEALAAYRRSERLLLGGDRPERLRAVEVSTDYFRVLGLDPVLGRTLGAADLVTGEVREAVLSHGFWLRRFGGGEVLGRELDLEGESYRVAGVLPAAGEYRVLGWGDLWLPLQLDEAAALQEPVWGFSVLGRLAPGVSLTAVGEELDALARGLAAARPETNEGWGVEVQPLRQWIVGDSGAGLKAALAAALGILLIACANVSSLFLVRFLGRRDELRTRAALGAGRARLLAPFLGEGLLVALAGGAGGIALAASGVEVLQRIGASRIPRLDEVTVDGRVLAATVAVSLLCGLASVLPPAMSLGLGLPRLRAASGARWSEPARTGSFPAGRVQAALVTFQVALALVLAVSTALVVRSQERLQQVDPGFEARGLLKLWVQLPAAATGVEADGGAGGKAERISRLRQVQERIRALPGIEEVAFSMQPLPLAGDQGVFSVYPPGSPRQPGEEVRVLAGSVSPEFFRTLAVPLLEGRPFEVGETWESSHAVIVNRTLARSFWPEGAAVGREVHFSGAAGEVGRVVGVVGDTRQLALELAPKGQLFVPWGSAAPLQHLVVRARPEVREGLFQRIEEEVWSAAGASVFGAETGEEIHRASLARHGFLTLLLEVAAGAAVLLGIIGLHGLVATGVGWRRREIGVRMALGASPGRILGTTLGMGIRPVALGLVLGLPGVALAGRGLDELLFQTSALEPGTLLTVVSLLACAAVLACWLPARTASATDPAEVLRGD